MGGSNENENLIELTIEEHAEAHKILYEKYGKLEDFLAWRGLLGQISKEEIISEISKQNGKINGKFCFENKLGIFSLTDKEKKLKNYKGGKISGLKNAKSGHCAKIANLGGKASSGMKFWFNPKTNKETRSFECPGKEWIPGIKMERINIENLKKHSNNVKGKFWIHNPDTNESKMISSIDEMPEEFIYGRKIEIKNTIELINVGFNFKSELPKIKSEFKDIRFDNSYKRWIFEFELNNKKHKITHIDYYGLLWSRDCIINYYKLDKIKSKKIEDSLSKEEISELLKDFKEYLKIKNILAKKLKKSKKDAYFKKLLEYEKNYDIVLEKIQIYDKKED
jgi:hypothetical protein